MSDTCEREFPYTFPFIFDEYTRCVEENLDITDYLTKGSFISKFEGVDITDIPFYTIALYRLFIASLNISDFINLVQSHITSIFNSFNITDYTSNATNYIRKRNEDLNIVDIRKSVVSIITNIYESLNLSDFLGYINSTKIKTLEIFNISDHIVNIVDYVREWSKTLNINDIIRPAITIVEIFYETFNVSTFLNYINNTKIKTLESLNITDYLNTIRTYFRSWYESFNITDYLIHTFKRPLVEVLDVTDYMDSVTNYVRKLTRHISIIHYLHNNAYNIYYKNYKEVFDISDYTSRTVTWLREIKENLSVLAVYGRISGFTMYLINSLDISDYVKSSYGFRKEYFESLDITDSFRYAWDMVGRKFTELLNLGMWRFGLVVSYVREPIETFSITEYLTYTTNYIRAYFDSFNIIDIFKPSTEYIRKFVIQLDLVEHFLTFVPWARSFLESLDLRDILKNPVSYIRNLFEDITIVSILETTLGEIVRILKEAFILSDNLFKMFYKKVYDVLNITDIPSYVHSIAYFRNWIESLNITDSLTKRLIIPLVEVFDISDYFTRVSAWTKKYVNHFGTLYAYLSTEWTAFTSYLESLDIVESLVTWNGIKVILNETLNLADSVTEYFREVSDHLLILVTDTIRKIDIFNNNRLIRLIHSGIRKIKIITEREDS